MNLVRREGFVTALRQGILWYSIVTVRPSRMVEGPNGIDWEAR